MQFMRPCSIPGQCYQAADVHVTDVKLAGPGVELKQYPAVIEAQWLMSRLLWLLNTAIA